MRISAFAPHHVVNGKFPVGSKITRPPHDVDGLVTIRQMKMCMVCGVIPSGELCAQCDGCDEYFCDACLTEEAEDGRRCPQCKTECDHCDAPITRDPAQSEHILQCAGCQQFRCHLLIGRVCCGQYYCKNDKRCEQALMAKVPRPCCVVTKTVACEIHPLTDGRCDSCDNRVCPEHMSVCNNKHHTCCTACYKQCPKCGDLHCPLCPPPEHTPHQCRSIACDKCTEEKPCRAHAYRYCPICDSEHGDAGWCKPCMSATQQQLTRCLPHVSQSGPTALVLGYLGAFDARDVGQLIRAQRKPASFRTQQVWMHNVADALQLSPQVKKYFTQRSVVEEAQNILLPAARHAAVVAFETLFHRRNRRVLPAFFTSRYSFPTTLSTESRTLQRTIVARVNRRRGRKKVIKDSDWNGLFVCVAKQYGWKPTVASQEATEESQERPRKRVRFV